MLEATVRGGDGQRPSVFFPSQINTYRQCPERYYLQYIRKLKRAQPFSAALAKGGATHRLLARHVPGYLRHGRIGADLHALAREEVAAGNYPESERKFIEQDAQDVVTWTEAALELLPHGARSMFIEKNMFAPVGGRGVQVGARIDLVLQHADGTIEHVDFKTGKLKDDPVQRLISRTVVGKRIPGAGAIRTTTIYAAHRHADRRELLREDSEDEWRTVSSAIRAIRSTAEWPSRPGPLCEFCQFRDRDCSAW